jgi:hypothetical protein
MAFLFVSSAYAAKNLPKNLTPAEQNRTLEILGFGSASKILNNPYPLGGYSGIELGLSTEYIPVDDLATLGSGTTEHGEFNYYTLTLGKGLYYNVDTYVYFTPSVQGEDFQNFGAQVRWGFYEFKFFPLSLSAVLYGGGANFSNLINISTFGADLIATVNMDNVAIYAGGGSIRAVGKFIGGAAGITASQDTEEQDLVEVHSVFGINIGLAKMFIAMEIDRYTDTVYSGKLGFRF